MVLFFVRSFMFNDCSISFQLTTKIISALPIHPPVAFIVVVVVEINGGPIFDVVYPSNRNNYPVHNRRLHHYIQTILLSPLPLPFQMHWVAFH